MSLDPLIIVFTGIDGFLTTSKSSARIFAAASRLAEDNVPAILCGSHTRAEIDEVRCDIGNTHPFITENGAALHIPECYIGHIIGGVMMSRLPRWLSGRQRTLVESAIQILRKRLPR